jgi:TetR/AcrR family transcriptional regulator, transcriptional repressor of bet genes
MSVVSHDERRRKIADVTVGIIAKEGLEAATVRRIAAEVGCSTTVITHYFSDKHELLLWTYRTLGEFGHAEFERTAPPDSRDLIGYLLSMAAIHDTNIAFWRTYVAIWDRSLRDPDIAAELNSWTGAVLDRIELFIRVINPECKNVGLIARRLLAGMQGISIQRLFDPESWSPDAVREALESEIDLLVHKNLA